MKKFLSTTLAVFLLCTATACAGDFDDIKHVPPELKPVEATIFSPSEKSTWNKDDFVSKFRATKAELSDEEFNQKYTAFYNYVPQTYSDEYDMDAFEVQQSDGNSIFYVRQADNLYRIDPFATDTAADYNGFLQFAVTDLNEDGCAEILVSYHYNGVTLTGWSYIHAIDTRSRKSVRFNRSYYAPIFFQKTDKGIGLYKGAENNPTTAMDLVSEVTKNTRKYVFLKKSFTVQASDYKAEVEIDEATINFPIVAEDLPLQFTSRVKMTWLGEGFGYTNGDGYLDGAYARYSNGNHTLECEPVAADDVITEFYIPNGAEIDREYYMHRLDELDCLGDYSATISYRFSEEKPVVESVFRIEIM